MAIEKTSICEQCGATIYHEHIDAGIARYEGGKMLCPHCVEEYDSTHDGSVGGTDEALDPIAFDENSELDSSESRIQAFGGVAMGGGKWDESAFMRPLDTGGKGASRCRTFHSKLNDGAIDFMTTQINDWLEANKNITIKFSNSTIGVFEGKHPEPNLILTLFY